MRKGPLIAAVIEAVVGLAMIIVGAIFRQPFQWSDYVLWIGIIIVNISLIVLVIAFIKKPGEKEETTSEAAA
jgi:hypothetical protein